MVCKKINSVFGMVLLFSSSVFGQTKIVYTYDELGRMTKVTDAVNGDRAYEYDPAGNRKSVVVSALNNRPPVAKNDSVSARPLYKAVLINVLANDSDPDNDQLVISSIQNNNASIAFVRKLNETSLEVVGVYPGSGTAKYTIVDGKGGSATAILYFSVYAN